MSLRSVSVLGAVLAGLIMPAATCLAAEPVAYVVDLREHHTSTYYTSAAIQGYGELELLVDTGSSHLAINQGILEKMQAASEVQLVRHLKGNMADGSSQLVPVYRIPALRLGDNCWVHNVEAAVLPGAVRPILGMNVLSRMAPFMFSADPPQLQLSHCEQPLVVKATHKAS